ncbi:MAG: DNA polymerase III subunit delta' [Methylovirgula sp.]|nr:DNA polymerase III subunit delta' [Methylovirgula sp.]
MNAPRSKALEAAPESDRVDETPHPRETIDFFGHHEAEQGLLEAYRADRLAQAFVIGGPTGIGKATLAWRLARFLLAHPDPTAAAVQGAKDLSLSAQDPIAHKVAALSHGDIALLRREWNEKGKRHYTEIRVDDVRQASHLFRNVAGAGGYRICIVDSAEDLNNSAANALLKLVEEPPPRSLFLIVAHRPALLLPTLRSRCQMLTLRPLAPADILRVIDALGAPWTEASGAERQAAAERAQGSVATALSLLADEGIALDNQVRALLSGLPALDWRAVHALADRIAGRDQTAQCDRVMTAIVDWIDERLRGEAAHGPARLAPLAEVWEKAADAAREAEVLNLDKRPVILSIFAELAAARAVNA